MLARVGEGYPAPQVESVIDCLWPGPGGSAALVRRPDRVEAGWIRNPMALAGAVASPRVWCD